MHLNITDNISGAGILMDASYPVYLVSSSFICGYFLSFDFPYKNAPWKSYEEQSTSFPWVLPI